MSAFVPPGECPACGEHVPAGAHSCPAGGADTCTGWSEDTRYDGLDLPDEAFEDDTLPGRHSPRAAGRTWKDYFAVGVAILLVLILSGIWFVFRG
jgi:hypothetical protein